MQIIRNFIGQADNADHPQKKSMAAWNWSVRSPCVMAKIITTLSDSSGQQFSIRFHQLTVDRPLLLLIVTMLVSTPLLLCWPGVWQNRRVS